MKLSKIGVFCGSSNGYDSCYKESVTHLANAMHDANLDLVYGGAQVGLMGLLADQILKHKKQVIGVLPQALQSKEVAHNNLTKLYIVDSMHERKVLIADLSDAFILLPGGFGSLDEFFEVVTLAQLNFHSKPCGILNVSGYYDSILHFLDQAVEKGFVKATHRDMIIVEESAKILIEKMEIYEAPNIKKWINAVECE